jgi:PAS domain S-box-containing protein
MSIKVLVVEDSDTQALALRSLLVQEGFHVTRAATGEEALAQLEQARPDLVLSDIVMPGVSGYELCRRIKCDPTLSSLPVVLLTSLVDPLDIVRGLECGADNYVTKPYDPEYLCTRLRHVLDRQRLRTASKASLGVNVRFLGTSFTITSEREQILDLFISTVEDVVRTNHALHESQRELAVAQARLEEYAHGMTLKAQLSDEKYAALMHQASDAILVLDLSGEILESNERATELFGLPADALRGRTLRQFAALDDIDRLDRKFRALHETSRVTTELTFASDTGRRATCVFSASRTRSRDGDLVLAILHDVTIIHDATNRARKSQWRLEQAQQLSAVGSWERDLVTGASEWSAETFRLFGMEPHDGDLRSEFLEAVDPFDRDAVAAALRDVEASGRRLSIEFRVNLRDGGSRLLHGRGELVRDERGLPSQIRGTVQDITERRQLEEQLRQAQKMEAVGQLAGGVAHDFNNLLTVITSYSGLLLADLPESEPIRAEIREIEEAARRAAALTRQLLAFSRRQVLQPQQVEVTSLIEQLEKLLRRLVREDIHIATTLGADTGTVWADPGQLEQVLVNLVVNARDAMPDGGSLTIRTTSSQYPPHLTPSAEMTSAAGRCVLIEVSDTGTGMTPAVKARIFEPFFTTKGPGAGTGLGLSTVYGIVRQSGGDIAVQSAPGAGTTFRVYLPARTGAPPVVGPASERGTSFRGGETILIVEDDEALRTVACRILREQGYDVRAARNGREALALCAEVEKPIHLVLTDMVMPEMSGHELGREIASRFPGVRVLFMSGHTQDALLHEGVAQGTSSFLDKPFTPATLASKIREVLDNSGVGGELAQLPHSPEAKPSRR